MKGARVAVGANDTMTRWWFQIFVYVHPQLGKIPIFTNIFRWVETTNQMNIFSDFVLFD